MNKVLLIGRIANDLVLNKTKSNISFLRLTLAVTRKYTSNDGSEVTDFIPVVCWRGTAEFLAKNAIKGTRISVEGSFVTNNFVNSQGQNISSNEVSADNVSILESKSEIEKRKNNSNSSHFQKNIMENNDSSPTFSVSKNQINDSPLEENEDDLSEDEEVDWNIESFL